MGQYQATGKGHTQKSVSDVVCTLGTMEKKCFQFQNSQIHQTIFTAAAT